MSNSASEIIDKVQDLIEKWDIVGLTSELNLPKYQSWLQENAWDLIPPLVEVATEDNINQCPQVVHTCSKLLSDPVAFHGKPKEVIISILEQCEHSGASIKFRHCLPAIETSLIKLNAKGASLTWPWALHTLIGHVNSLDLPDLPELDAGNDRLALEHDQAYAERLKMVEEIATLLKSLVKKYQSEFEEVCNIDYALKIKGCIMWSCILLLARPLAIMNVSVTAKGDSSNAKIISDELMQILNHLCFNQLTIVDHNNFCHQFKQTPLEDDNKIHLWAVGIASVFFNHLAFGISDIPIPACYEPLFVLNKLLSPICISLDYQTGTSSEYLRLEKALILCQALTRRIPSNTIPSDIMEMPQHSLLLARLYQIIVYHTMSSIRKMAFAVYNIYFDTFAAAQDSQGRSLKFLVLHAFEKANHSGIIAHAIGKFKNAILKGFAPDIIGGELNKLVKKFCHLKNGAETDLLEVNDEIIASLNLLIALLLRDKQNDIFGLWDLVPDLTKNYLEPLSQGLSLSRAHFKLKLQEPKSAQVTLMVGGQVLPEMSPEQKNQVIHSALNTFDMTELVLCRLNDVIANANQRK